MTLVRDVLDRVAGTAPPVCSRVVEAWLIAQRGVNTSPIVTIVRMSQFFQRDLLKGRVALVTGGGTGICRGIALAFAAHGCDVAITSRNREHLDPAVAELRGFGVRAVGHPADVRHPDAVNGMMSTVVYELGRLDILINGAAGNFVCLAENLSPN